MAIFNTNLVQITGLTADGDWHLKDLSGAPWSLPATASGVMLVVRNTDGSTQQYGFRKPGSTDNRSGGIVSKAQYTAFVGIDASRQLSYKLSSSNVQVYLAGYFEYDAVFFDNGIQKTITYSNQWNLIDESSNVPSNAKFVILECLDISESTNNFGVQPGDPTCYDIRPPIKYHLWAVCGLSAARHYTLYGNTGSHQVFLVGYITGGSQKVYAQPDITNTTNGSFEDRDLSAQTPPPRVTGAIVLMDWNNGDEHANKRYAIRKNSSTDDWTANCELRGMVYYPVGIDAGNILESKVDDASIHQEMYLMGFLANPLNAAPLEAVTSMSFTVNAERIMAPMEAITSMEAIFIPSNALVLTMPVPDLQMTGTAEAYDFDDMTPVSGSLSLVLNPPSLLMSGFVEARGNLVLTMPPPVLIMTGDQFFAARYFKGLVMNMTHHGVTEYIGYDFNSLAYFDGEFYGGNGEGIFKIGGNKDNGLNINARAKMPILDQFRDVMKKARDAWLTCRKDGQMMLVLQLDEEVYYEDVFEQTGKAHEERVKLPKGIKNRFVSFEVRNVDGSDFDLDTLRFTTDTISRRKR